MTPRIRQQHRWGFLYPWCEVLRNSIGYYWTVHNGGLWDIGHPNLAVHLPTPYDTYSEDGLDIPVFVGDGGGRYFQTLFQNIREALALLSAVAHLDQSAFKVLLQEHCNVEFGEEGEEQAQKDVPVDFLLDITQDMERYPDTLKEEIVAFCGVQQREHPSVGYLKALKKISDMDATVRRSKVGKEIEIPVRVRFYATEIGGQKASMKPIEDIWAAEKAVEEEWRTYAQSGRQKEVEPGKYRCTFVLAPMIANFNDVHITAKMSEVVKTLVRENAWFSQFSLRFALDHSESDPRTLKKRFGELVSSVFDSTQRSPRPKLRESTQSAGSTASGPLQMGTVLLDCPGRCFADFDALCSAIVVNQTARKISMLLRLGRDEDLAISEHCWKWLAYSLFSKRARGKSFLESLSLSSIGGMSVQDMEAFVTVLRSDHPEELLFDCPRGRLDERDAEVKAGAPIYWEFTNRGQRRRHSQPLVFDTTLLPVRTFSDDGVDEFVNIMVPGFGRCQAKRSDLVFTETALANYDSPGLTSLNIELVPFDEHDDEGLPQFLAAIGHSLKVLTLNDVRDDIDEIAILKSCPNLEELALYGGCAVDVRMNFSEYHASNLPLPDLVCNWLDILAISIELEDPSTTLAKCVRRLRVPLTELAETWLFPHEGDDPDFAMALDELLVMLETNHTLEYLDVILPVHYWTDLVFEFEAYHLEPTSRALALPIESKIAFMSVFAYCQPNEPTHRKRGRRASREALAQFQLDQNVLSTVFAFAAPHVLREVYIHKARDNETSVRDRGMVI